MPISQPYRILLLFSSGKPFFYIFCKKKGG
jgi:hypothetical protein